MVYDEKLVEAVARTLCREDGHRPDEIRGDEPLWTEWAPDARAALAAIDASGTHWIAPQVATKAIATALDPRIDPLSGYNPQILWDELRDACLAERLSDGREDR